MPIASWPLGVELTNKSVEAVVLLQTVEARRPGWLLLDGEMRAFAPAVLPLFAIVGFLAAVTFDMIRMNGLAGFVGEIAVCLVLLARDGVLRSIFCGLSRRTNSSPLASFCSRRPHSLC